SRFEGRPIQRFWLLGTVTRIPFLAFGSALIGLELVGLWRNVGLRQLHAAEEWNELHNLLIMESLCGGTLLSDRFVANHLALAFYGLTYITYLVSPRITYELSELLAVDALDSYNAFVARNSARLAELPPPWVAKSYYSNVTATDPSAEIQMQLGGLRRPPCASLRDVFTNIVDDEFEHVANLDACQ
ncbi:alternative oxidase, partial [Pavlovales sp. CCMP2436]